MTLPATAEENDPDAFPRPFGTYLLLENFARGGMGEVYLAKSGGIAGLEKYCVLKKLRSELTRDREYVTRFIDEARVVVTLNHANVCHVFDVGRVGEEYYLAMEYVSGRDVRTIQDRCRTREKPIPPAIALHMVCETLEALDYAHRRNHPLTGEPLNLVHRDVSPQNVLVSYEGEIKLIDFGLAASKLKVERTQPNVVMGKMAYMAPEQARGDPIDSRADLFACGVLAYELISGERFYEGMSANDIWQVAGKGGFVPRKWEAIDKDLAKQMARALHPDPKKRFASCGDFREVLASHMHWRFPGTGVRGLRDVMSDLFAVELQREREMLARFGKVTVAGFRTEFESTQSHSVSLARADETGPTGTVAKTTLVRNEQSASAGPMPAPNGLPSRDVHQDPTRLSKDNTDTVPRAKKDTTDESPDAPRAEMTMRVARARVSTLVDDDTALGIRPGSSRRGALAVAATLAVVAVAAAVFVVTRPPAPVDPPEPAHGVTTARSPPLPLAAVPAPAPTIAAPVTPPVAAPTPPVVVPPTAPVLATAAPLVVPLAPVLDEPREEKHGAKRTTPKARTEKRDERRELASLPTEAPPPVVPTTTTLAKRDEDKPKPPPPPAVDPNRALEAANPGGPCSAACNQWLKVYNKQPLKLLQCVADAHCLR